MIITRSKIKTSSKTRRRIDRHWSPVKHAGRAVRKFATSTRAARRETTRPPDNRSHSMRTIRPKSSDRDRVEPIDRARGRFPNSRPNTRKHRAHRTPHQQDDYTYTRIYVYCVLTSRLVPLTRYTRTACITRGHVIIFIQHNTVVRYEIIILRPGRADDEYVCSGNCRKAWRRRLNNKKKKNTRDKIRPGHLYK